MSTLANWIGMGANAAGFVAAVMLMPKGNVFEQDMGWWLLCLAYLVQVVRFLSEALKKGRWPAPPAAYATNWIRYVGAGVSAALFIGSMTSLCRGGVRQFIYTIFGVLFYYAGLVFAALVFETNSAVIGFYTIAAAVFVFTVMMFYRSGEYGRQHISGWVPMVAFIIEAGFIAMAGVELFRRNVAGNDVEDWVFMGIALVKAVFYIICYVGSVDSLAIVAATEEIPTRQTMTYSATAAATQFYDD